MLIALDTETSSLHPHTNNFKLIGVALYDGEGIKEFTNDFDRVKSIAENPDNTIVCHNIKFDYSALATVGIHIANGACTLAMAHMVDENRFDHSLDSLSRDLLNDHKDDTAIKVMSKFGWDQIPWEILEPYAIKDAELCYRLYHLLAPKCDNALVRREFQFVTTVAKMEARGILTDPQLISERIKIGTERMNEIERELGFDPKKPSLLSKYLHETLGLPILAKTKTGRPQMDKKTMERYDEMLEGLPILEYRGWQKAISSYYDKLLQLGPTIHPDYQLQGTVTGRLSCKNPNLQQIPRSSSSAWNEGSKEIFVPSSPDYELVEYDYSQLEFRLCAAYAQEKILLEEFSRPTGDVFTAMASQLSLPRQQVKTLTYSVLYGAGVRRIATVFNVPEYEAGKLRDRFYDTYKGIFTLSKRTEAVTIQRGFIKLWTGRQRHLTRDHAYKAMNSLIQGGAAELVKEAMLRCSKFAPSECRMLLQVHDAIVFEIRRDLLPTYDLLIRDNMTQFDQFNVTLAVDGHYFRTGSKVELFERTT